MLSQMATWLATVFSQNLLSHAGCILLAFEELVCELLPVMVAGTTPNKAEQG